LFVDAPQRHSRFGDPIERASGAELDVAFDYEWPVAFLAHVEPTIANRKRLRRPDRGYSQAFADWSA
jgi:hypothetical protein